MDKCKQKFIYKLIEHIENVEENKVGYFIKKTEINFDQCSHARRDL